MQALVDRGLVAKTVSLDDARGVVLALTRVGRRSLPESGGHDRGAFDAAVFAVLSVMERKTLRSLLDKVGAALDAPADQDG